MATSSKQSINRPDLVIHDKKRKEIIIEVGMTSQDQLQKMGRDVVLYKLINKYYKCYINVEQVLIFLYGIELLLNSIRPIPKKLA